MPTSAADEPVVTVVPAATARMSPYWSRLQPARALSRRRGQCAGAVVVITPEGETWTHDKRVSAAKPARGGRLRDVQSR